MTIPILTLLAGNEFTISIVSSKILKYVAQAGESEEAIKSQ